MTHYKCSVLHLTYTLRKPHEAPSQFSIIKTDAMHFKHSMLHAASCILGGKTQFCAESFLMLLAIKYCENFLNTALLSSPESLTY